MTDTYPPPAIRRLARIFAVLIPLLMLIGLIGTFAMVVLNKVY